MSPRRRPTLVILVGPIRVWIVPDAPATRRRARRIRAALLQRPPASR